MTPILYEKDEIDFTSQGLGSLVEIYDVDVAEQRNGLLQLTASYPVTGVRYDDISVGRIILAKPNQRDEPHAFRITSTDLDIMGHNVMIEADSITYDLNHNIVKHLNVSGADGQTMMSALKNAIVNPSIFTFYSDITHVSSTSLDYVNPMEAVMGVKGSFLQIWGGELKRENRRVAMFNRRGRDNVATFRLGKNISGLKYKVDISSLVTRILPIKSVQENDTTTYLEGTPVSSQYINSYEQIYTIKVDFTDDTIKTVDDLNKASANWFVDSANTARDKPSVTIDIDVLSLQDSADYQDKFKDLESVGLTDTVTVYVPEYGINVTAIVNELHFDPIQERVTKLTVGTARMSFADSSRVQLSDLQDKVISVQEQADQIAVSANGKNTNYYGSIAPSHPQAGDLWYWVNGDFSGIKQFVNGDWADVVDTNTQQQITDGVNQAVQDAQKYSDKLVADNAEQVNRTLSDVQAKQADLSSQQAGLDTKAQGYANKALADAKANTLVTATQTAKDASDALAKAKTDLTTSLNKEVTDRVNAVTALDTKAKGYADTAKADAINAATTADGVINKKIDDTASSITSTISQNKTDADGKITTAQNTATQALNGLATKVSQTVFDTKTGQLQTDLNTTTATANTSKQDIVAIKSDNTKQDARMTTIESDANGTKTTVSNLQTDLGKANGSITTLQQRADGFDATVTKVNTLLNDLSQVNMVVNSEFSPDLAGWYIRGTQTLLSDGPNSSDVGFNKSGHVVLDTTNGTGTGNVNYTSMAYPVTPSSIISVSVELKASVSGTNPQIGFIYYDANMNAVAGQRGGVPVTTDYKLWKYMGTAIPATAKYVSFDILISNVYKAKYVMSQPMMVIGSTVGAYVQGQYNNNGATAKAQLTADNATTTINNYKTSNDGRVATAESNISQNATAITQKVSQTDYNQKTGQLQTDLNTTTNTANTAKQDIATIKTDNTTRDEKINTLESDSTETKRTISKLSGDLNTVSGDVSTLKQTAQGFEATVTKVNNMSVGGRNLFLNSKTLWNVANNGNSSTKVTFDDTTNMWHITAPAPVTAGRGIYFYQTSNTSKPLVKGDKWAMSIDIKGTGMLREFGAEGSTNQTQPTGPIPSEWTRLSSTGTAVSTGAIIIYFGAGADTTQALDVYVKLPKLELGTMATAWSPAPEDVDSSISSVKQTADSASTAITNYKVSNDGRVSAAEGNIKTNADAITQKVSIVDYNTNNGTVSTRIGKIETANDKITQSVSSLTTQVNAMGQINQLFNTEFSPDFAGWGYWDGDMKKSTSNITNSRLVISNRYKGSNKILTDSSIDARYVTSTIPISISSNQPMVARVTADSDKAGSTLRLHISFHDANGIQTGNVYTVGNLTTTPQDIVVAFNGPLPPNTVSAYLVVMVVGKAAWTQPMVIYGDTIGAYTPGAYNSTQKIASQQITIDSISDVVSNPTTGLTKRVQTAEGTLNQVQGTDIPALQKATYWQAPNGYDLNTYMAQGSTFFRDTIARTNAPTTSTKWMYLVVERTPNGDRITQTAWYDTQTDAKITYRRQYAGSWGAWYANDNDSVTSIKQTNSAIQQEVKDRTNGDSNTLTQAKDFTTSSITSSETGMKSLITQTSDSIVAQIGSTGVRYVRINGQGNQDNQGTHFMRVSLFDSSGKDLLLGKTATVSGPNSPYFGGNNGGNGATDGNVNTYNAIYPEPNANNFMVYDLGAVTYTSQKFEVKMWTNYRTYKGVTIQVSPDNKSWRTVLQEDVKSVSGDITKPDTTVNLGNTSSATQLALLKDNWSIGIAGNTGALASGIAGDANAMAVVSPKVIINSPQTQITGKLTAAQIDTKELSALSANLGNVSSGSITNPINQAWSAGTGATLLGTTVIDNRGINMNADIKTASNPKLYSETVSISPDTGIKFSWRDYTGGTVLPPVPLDMSMSSAGIVASSGKQYVSIVGNSITADNETAGTATTMSAMVSNPDGGINAGGAQSSAYIRYVTGQNDTQNLPLVMGLERIGNIVMVSFNFVTYGSTIRADAIQMNGPKIPVGFRPVDNVHIQAHANNGGTTIGTITFTITPDGKVLQTSPAINGIARIMGSATYLTYMIGAQAGFVVKDAQGNTTW